MVKYESDVKYHAKQIKRVVMRKDVVYLGMIRWNDSISLNTGDEGYNNGKKYGQKGTICGPNINNFCTTNDSSRSSPNPLIALTT
jgi:hypothetical protein